MVAPELGWSVARITSAEFTIANVNCVAEASLTLYIAKSGADSATYIADNAIVQEQQYGDVDTVDNLGPNIITSWGFDSGVTVSGN